MTIIVEINQVSHKNGYQPTNENEVIKYVQNITLEYVWKWSNKICREYYFSNTRKTKKLDLN